MGQVKSFKQIRVGTTVHPYGKSWSWTPYTNIKLRKIKDPP